MNQLEIVKMLLEKGANPNNGGSNKMPPIFWAILNEAIFMALLEKGALLNTKNGYRQTLKHYIEDFDGVPEAVKSRILQESVPVGPAAAAAAAGGAQQKRKAKMNRGRKTLRKKRAQSRRK